MTEQQNHVQNRMMDEYISKLQAEAKVAVKEADETQRKMKQDIDDEHSENRRRREQAQHNQHRLRHQMEENKMRRAEDRREYIEAASSHSFPLFTETFISLDEVNQYRADQKRIFREELDHQLMTINTMKNLRKKEDNDYAYDKKVTNIGQMTKDRKAERDRLAKQGRDMVASWDRDLRLQSIKKAILSGKDVVRQTLGPGAVASPPASEK